MSTPETPRVPARGTRPDGSEKTPRDPSDLRVPTVSPPCPGTRPTHRVPVSPPLIGGHGSRDGDTPPDCTRCGSPLVAAKSRRIGLCAGCTAQADSCAPTEAGQVEHAPDCPGPRIVEHDATRNTIRTCTACGAWATRPRVSRWLG